MPIRMSCKSAFRARENRLVRRPRPTAKSRKLIIAERLVDFIARIHHERPILYDRLANRPPLQKQELAFVLVILDTNLDLLIKLHRRMRGERFAADFHRTAAEKIKRAIRVWSRRRYRPLGTRGHFDRPYGDVAIRQRCP